MKPTRVYCLLLAAISTMSVLHPAAAQDQFGPPSLRRPTTSPYLNLLRGQDGGGTGLRYFGIVRPEQQLRRAADQASRDISNLNRRVDEQQTPDARSLETSILSPTGHATTFFSTGQYFPVPGRR